MDVASREVWKDNPNVEEVDEDLGGVRIPKNPMESFDLEIEEDFGEDNVGSTERKYQEREEDTKAEKVAEKLEDKVVDKVSDNVADKVTDDVTKKVTDNLSEQMKNDAMLQVEMLKAQTEQQRVAVEQQKVQVQAAALNIQARQVANSEQFFADSRARQAERDMRLLEDKKEEEKAKKEAKVNKFISRLFKLASIAIVLIILAFVFLNPEVNKRVRTGLSGSLDWVSSIVSGDSNVESNGVLEDMGVSLNEMNKKVIYVDDESGSETE